MSQETLEGEKQQVGFIDRLIEGLAAQQASMAESRTVKRFLLNVAVSIHSCVNGTNHVFGGWAGEASYEGLSILTTFELFPGRELNVNFEPAVGHPCHMPVKLTHCDKRVGGIYRSGGNFCYDDAPAGRGE
jgi:hypothetical protein